MNNKFKHPLERYKLIADPTIRQQCIDNFDEGYWKDYKKSDDGKIEHAILYMCDWENSPEKFNYWNNIHDKAVQGTLPILPELIEEEHECKYCKAMTTQPDEQCYKAPKDVSELDQLRSENEKLRECLEILLSSYLVQVKGDNRNTYAVDQAKQLLNK